MGYSGLSPTGFETRAARGRRPAAVDHVAARRTAAAVPEFEGCPRHCPWADMWLGGSLALPSGWTMTARFEQAHREQRAMRLDDAYAPG